MTSSCPKIKLSPPFPAISLRSVVVFLFIFMYLVYLSSLSPGTTRRSVEKSLTKIQLSKSKQRKSKRGSRSYVTDHLFGRLSLIEWLPKLLFVLSSLAVCVRFDSSGKPAQITLDIRIEESTFSSQRVCSCFRVLLNASRVSTPAFRGSSVKRQAKL